MVRWVVVGLGIILVAIRAYWIDQHTFVWKPGQRVKINFELLQEPKEYIYYDKLLISVPGNLDLHYGDYLEAIGDVETIVTTNNKAKYWLRADSFRVIARKNSLGKQINTLRQLLVKQVKNWLPPDEAGLATGMLFGGTGDMSQRQILAYRRAGLSHIVAASGYNVTLVAMWASWLITRIMHRNYAIPLVIVVIILYSIMAGGSASVVRAAIMSIIMVVGLALGRESDIRWVLVLGILIMLIINPAYLTDIGFQLSVAATSGLVFFNPKSVWWTSIVAQITTTPIILHHFGNLSLVAPLANILVLWTVPIIMQITAVAVVTGGFLSYLAWPLLKWCNMVVYYLSSFEFSSLTVKPVGLIWVAMYYLVLLIVYKLKFENQD